MIQEYLIPENLDIRNQLHKKPIEVGTHINSFENRVRKAVILIDNLIRAYNALKTTESKQGYLQNMSSRTLQGLVKDYKAYLDYFIKYDIIKTDNWFTEGKCKGYGLTDRYRYSKLTTYPIPEAETKQNTQTKKQDFIVCTTTKEKYPMLYSDYSNVRLDDNVNIHNLVYRTLGPLISQSVKSNDTMTKNSQLENNKKIELQNSWFSKLHSMQHGLGHFKQDSTSNRLHTGVLAIKSELRGLLLYGNQYLINCDISNCQPLLSTILLNGKDHSELISEVLKEVLYVKNNGDKKHYYSIMDMISSIKKNPSDQTKLYLDLAVSGKIYSYFGSKMGITGTCKEVKGAGKAALITVLFNSWRAPNKKQQLFHSLFKQVAELFILINRKFKFTKAHAARINEKKQNNLLAILLQSIESKLILDTICPKLKKIHKDIPLITLHDGIATTPKYYDTLHETMNSVLKEHISDKVDFKKEDFKQEYDKIIKWCESEDLNNGKQTTNNNPNMVHNIGNDESEKETIYEDVVAYELEQ